MGTASQIATKKKTAQPVRSSLSSSSRTMRTTIHIAQADRPRLNTSLGILRAMLDREWRAAAISILASGWLIHVVQALAMSSRRQQQSTPHMRRRSARTRRRALLCLIMLSQPVKVVQTRVSGTLRVLFWIQPPRYQSSWIVAFPVNTLNMDRCVGEIKAVMVAAQLSSFFWTER
jgi:hypothetical protein